MVSSFRVFLLRVLIKLAELVIVWQMPHLHFVRELHLIEEYKL